jgi:hypothetical protein
LKEAVLDVVGGHDILEDVFEVLVDERSEARAIDMMR